MPLMIAAACLGGCEGGSDEPLSKRDYQHEISEIVGDTAPAATLFTDLVLPSRRERCADMAESFRDEVVELLDRVEALEPPPPLADAHERFLSAAEQSLDRLEAIAAEVESGEVQCGQELNDALYDMPSSRRAERAIADVERRGVVVFGE